MIQKEIFCRNGKFTEMLPKFSQILLELKPGTPAPRGAAARPAGRSRGAARAPSRTRRPGHRASRSPCATGLELRNPVDVRAIDTTLVSLYVSRYNLVELSTILQGSIRFIENESSKVLVLRLRLFSSHLLCLLLSYSSVGAERKEMLCSFVRY